MAVALDANSVSTHLICPMPEIGLDRHYYDRVAKEAEERGDFYTHEAAKVGMYISMALDRKMPWREKLRYFQHAIKRHTTPKSEVPSDGEQAFFGELALLIKTHCGAEALRLAMREDDLYATRLGLGQTPEEIEDDAEPFFEGLIGHDEHCPPHFLEDDWHTLRMIREQWI